MNNYYFCCYYSVEASMESAPISFVITLMLVIYTVESKYA